MDMAPRDSLAVAAQQPLTLPRELSCSQEGDFILRDDPTSASGAGEARSESAQEENAALAALELKLQYVSTQRALCAIKCQTFMEELERQQQLHAQQLHARQLQSGPRATSPGSRSARRSSQSVHASAKQRSGASDDEGSVRRRRRARRSLDDAASAPCPRAAVHATL